mmetsp:Transcript_25196/g.64483  ORF Transcript_25196/g.64483 Transcript_25196/m.64483 type:complete len:253 (-) Transcript_25196:54-812(-)
MDEVVFIEHGSTLVCLLFFEKLSDKEVMIIQGATRSCILRGHGPNLSCVGPLVNDTCPVGEGNIRRRELCTVFPTSYRHKVVDQYSADAMLTDVGRMYLSATPLAQLPLFDPAEGSWDRGEASSVVGDDVNESVSRKGNEVECDLDDETPAPLFCFPPGVGPQYGGNPQLRFVLLWLAASQAGRQIRVRTPPILELELAEDLKEAEELVGVLLEAGVSVAQLWGMVVDESSTLLSKGCPVFEMLTSKIVYGV